MCNPDFPYTEMKETIYVRCAKCSDRFKVDWGGRSARPSCRLHSLNKYGQCDDCGNASSNCYHIRKESWWSWLCGC